MNIKHIIASGFLAAGMMQFAWASEKAVPAGKDRLKEQIRKEMTFPTFLKSEPQHEEVKLSFTIDENGKAVLLAVNTANAELEKYVRGKMQVITFDAAHRNGKVHNMNLVFKLI